jgi:hypothetical protein
MDNENERCVMDNENEKPCHCEKLTKGWSFEDRAALWGHAPGCPSFDPDTYVPYPPTLIEKNQALDQAKLDFVQQKLDKTRDAVRALVNALEATRDGRFDNESITNAIAKQNELALSALALAREVL